MSSTPYGYTLRPYQEDADAWLEEHPHSIYADDTGLGKTPTSASVMARHLPALVVAPSYLAYNWFTELCAALPHASISYPDDGGFTRKRGALREHTDVRIINYDTMRRLGPLEYGLMHLESVWFDEAHRLRKRDSKQSIAAREQLCWVVPRVALVTGTPFYRADEDIWHLLHCLDSKRFSSYWDFIREWYSVNWAAAYAPKIYGISRAKREAFNAMLSEYMLMRTYEDVGRQLPNLIERTITFELPPPLRKEYASLLKKWQIAGMPVESVGAVYYLLRQLTMCHLKRDVVVDIVDSLPRGEGCLIYTYHLESAHTLAEHFKRHIKVEVPVMLITGETPPTTRAMMLAEQKRTGHPHIIVATIGALQEGQNMEHLRHVVYAEETYVKGEHTQTLARVRRDRGDEHQDDNQPPVNVYYVRARKTVDERIPAIRNSRGNAGDHELARQLRHESGNSNS